MPGVPEWFAKAVATAPEHRDMPVDGTRVHLRCWGEPGKPGLVLVHGGAAHSGWWDHIAPLLTGTRRVVAVDLSGHGDSEHREHYELSRWAREVVAAAGEGGAASPFSVAGHSMGGWVAATVGVEHPEQLANAVIIDSPLNDEPPEERRLRHRRRAPKIYPDRAAMLERFTTMPPQDVLLPYVREHIAAESIRPVRDGWTWKFDPSMFGQRIPLRSLLPQLRCPVAFVRSEFGLVPPTMAEEIDRLLDHRAPIVELPATGHHPMLDQPLALVTVLRALLASWQRGS